MENKLFKKFLILAIFFVLAVLIILWSRNLNIPDHCSRQGANLYFFDKRKNNFEVDFLDVGQGDSVLIKTEAGQNILIDGGPDSTVVKRLSENLSWWDRKIDLMILTHPHSDHVSGQIHVLNRYKVKKVLYTGVAHAIPEYAEWLQIIKNRNIPLKIIEHPQRVILDENAFLDIIYPFESLAGMEVKNLNNSSIVVKLTHGQNKFLLAGDIESEIEAKLLEKNIDLAAKVFKANHQGSDTSNTEEFLKAVNPQIIVITVGADNKFGHPNGRILKRFERIGAKIYRTDQNGTIKMKSDGNDIDNL